MKIDEGRKNRVKNKLTSETFESNIKRLQTAVRTDFGIGIRFAKWLGFTNEGLMKHYLNRCWM